MLALTPRRVAFVIMFVLAALLAACGGAPNETPTGDATASRAEVQDLDIQILESFPVQVTVIAYGTTPDTCSEIGEITQERQDETIFVTIPTTRPADAQCSDVIQPFEKVIPLDVLGLPAGMYTVDVNGVTDQFLLDADNTPIGSEAPTGVLVDSVAIQPSGTDPTGLEAVVAGSLPDACTLLGIATQTRNETGILLTLPGQREEPDVQCPPEPIPFTQNIALDVAALPAGTYILTVQGANAAQTTFTLPFMAISAVTPSSSTQTPAETPQPQATPNRRCTNRLAVLQDVTVPDDTRIQPGGAFTKTWRVRNAGTCTWTPEYSVVFEKGDMMSAPSSTPLPNEVRPGDTVDISVDLVAPAQAGDYQALFKVRTPWGTNFGFGREGRRSFWVKIRVPEAEPTATPAVASLGQEASISGLVWHDLCVASDEGEATPEVAPLGCVAAAQGGYQANGTFDTGEPVIVGVEVLLGSGTCPASGLASAITGPDGRYEFDGLQPGAYCVSIDPASARHHLELQPGQFTAPNDQGAVTLEIQTGQAMQDVNFGWDHRFLP